MDWLEKLPVNCPPSGAADIALEGVYRIISCADPTMDDFKSHAALNFPIRPGVDPCEWSSCSLFTSRDKAIDIAGKLSKFRFSDAHLALVNISPGDGRSLVNERTAHVHFWASKKFSLGAAIVDVEKV